MTNTALEASLKTAAELGLPSDLFIAQHSKHGLCIVAAHTVFTDSNGYTRGIGLYRDPHDTVIFWNPNFDDLTPVVATELPDWIMLKRHDRYGIVVASINTDFHPPLEATTQYDRHIAFIVDGIYDSTRRPYIATFAPDELYDI